MVDRKLQRWRKTTHSPFWQMFQNQPLQGNYSGQKRSELLSIFLWSILYFSFGVTLCNNKTNPPETNSFCTKLIETKDINTFSLLLYIWAFGSIEEIDLRKFLVILNLSGILENEWRLKVCSLFKIEKLNFSVLKCLSIFLIFVVKVVDKRKDCWLLTIFQVLSFNFFLPYKRIRASLFAEASYVWLF